MHSSLCTARVDCFQFTIQVGKWSLMSTRLKATRKVTKVVSNFNPRTAGPRTAPKVYGAVIQAVQNECAWARTRSNSRFELQKLIDAGILSGYRFAPSRNRRGSPIVVSVKVNPAVRERSNFVRQFKSKRYPRNND